MNIAIAPSNIVSVTWALTNTPPFSTAAFTNSPLGTNVPVYDVSDRVRSYQVAGTHALLRPDLVGQYTVVATIVTAGSGSTNVTQTITAGTYMGVNTCALCHSGGVVAEDKYTTWQTTAHASIFTNGINGQIIAAALTAASPASSATPSATTPTPMRSMAGLTMSPHSLGGLSRRCWPLPTGRTCRPCTPAGQPRQYPVRKLPRARQPARLLARQHQFHHQDGQFGRLQPMPRRPDPPHLWHRMVCLPPRSDDRPQQRQLLDLSLGQRLHCPGDCEHQWELCGHCDHQCDFCAH